jgi:signal transduction histidine kinase
MATSTPQKSSRSGPTLPLALAALAALDTATKAVAEELSVDRVLQVIVDQVRPLVGAQYAALGIVDERGVIERFITSGMEPEVRAAIGDLPRGHGLLGVIIRENRSIRIPDIAADRRRSGFPPQHPPMKSFLGAPVTTKGRSVGNLYLTNKQGATEFSADDQHLVETFAFHAGIAIENARLHERVQRLAVVDERERIARDLHDGIIQSMYAVGLSLEDVPELMREDPGEATARVERAIDALHLTIRDVRNFILGLRSELLHDGSLAGGVALLAEQFRQTRLVEVELRSDSELPEPAPERTAEVLAIVREALSNAGRHSKATELLLELRAAGDSVRVIISDNGVGFDPNAPRRRGHHGIVNMRNRALNIGGALALSSRPGGGTRVEITFPVGHRPDAVDTP